MAIQVFPKGCITLWLLGLCTEAEQAFNKLSAVGIPSTWAGGVGDTTWHILDADGDGTKKWEGRKQAMGKKTNGVESKHTKLVFEPVLKSQSDSSGVRIQTGWYNNWAAQKRGEAVSTSHLSSEDQGPCACTENLYWFATKPFLHAILSRSSVSKNFCMGLPASLTARGEFAGEIYWQGGSSSQPG